jgi:hypothetical protein
MVNARNTFVGLTRTEPGPARGEPGRLPTGTRNYVRLVPAHDVQGAADAMVARRLGIKRVYLVIQAEPGFTGTRIAAGSGRGPEARDRPRPAHTLSTEGPAATGRLPPGFLLFQLRARLERQHAIG